MGHLAGVGAALLVGVRWYYLAAWLYHSLRSLDTGLVYRLRLWPRPPVRVALGDYLHPWSAPVVGAWEDLAPWYDACTPANYELPVGWHGFHYAAAD